MAETGVDASMIPIDIERFYNGYLFHHEAKNRVYNPSMMLYLFDQVTKHQQKVEYVIDENLKTDYGRLQMLMKDKNNREQLIKIVEDNGVDSEIILKFSLDKLHENEYFVSLLFYLGLLTIDYHKEGKTYLKIPNYTIRTVFWEYIAKLTKDINSDVSINLGYLQDAISSLAYRGDPIPYLDYVSKNILSRLSNRDLQNFDEKYIKIILLYGLFQSKMYIAITEMEVSQGYTDIYMCRSHLKPDIPYEWVWEIKYVKKGGALWRKKSALKTKKKESQVQLKKYRDSPLFAGRTDVRYLSIIFIGKDKYVSEELRIEN
jgi:hypothetical protein